MRNLWNVPSPTSSYLVMSPQEFARLIDDHAGSLVLYARQWCDAPEDTVQEAFLKLAAQEQTPRDVRAWLFRVVRNAAIDAARGARRRERREAAVARPLRWFVESDAEGLDAEEAVAALQRLPLEEREPIVARLWGGLSFEEIGAIAGCSASTAFRRYTAGLEKLRTELGVPCPNRLPNA